METNEQSTKRLNVILCLRLLLGPDQLFQDNCFLMVPLNNIYFQDKITFSCDNNPGSFSIEEFSKQTLNIYWLQMKETSRLGLLAFFNSEVLSQLYIHILSSGIHPIHNSRSSGKLEIKVRWRMYSLFNLIGEHLTFLTLLQDCPWCSPPVCPAWIVERGPTYLGPAQCCACPIYRDTASDYKYPTKISLNFPKSNSWRGNLDPHWPISQQSFQVSLVSVTPSRHRVMRNILLKVRTLSASFLACLICLFTKLYEFYDVLGDFNLF